MFRDATSTQAALAVCVPLTKIRENVTGVVDYSDVKDGKEDEVMTRASSHHLRLLASRKMG